MSTLVIPGRVQCRYETMHGQEYHATVKRFAKRNLPAPYPVIGAGWLELSLELYYPVSNRARGLEDCPERWREVGLPKPDAAASIIVAALSGVLYESGRQVQPLVVYRHLQPKAELVRLMGEDCAEGCAVVSWARPQQVRARYVQAALPLHPEMCTYTQGGTGG